MCQLRLFEDKLSKYRFQCLFMKVNYWAHPKKHVYLQLAADVQWHRQLRKIYFPRIQKAHGRHNSVLWFKWSLKHLNISEISEEINSKFHSIASLAENESGFIWDNRLKFWVFFLCVFLCFFVLCFVVSVPCNLEWPLTHSEARLDLNSWSSWVHLPRTEITKMRLHAQHECYF